MPAAQPVAAPDPLDEYDRATLLTEVEATVAAVITELDPDPADARRPGPAGPGAVERGPGLCAAGNAEPTGGLAVADRPRPVPLPALRPLRPSGLQAPGHGRDRSAGGPLRRGEPSPHRPPFPPCRPDVGPVRHRGGRPRRDHPRPGRPHPAGPARGQ